MKEVGTDRRVARTRRRLREALVALMMERSYEKITVQQIIDRADVGRATFYNHYQDKDDLLLRGVARIVGDGTAPDGHPPPGRGGGRPETLHTAGMFRHSYKNRDLHHVMFRRSQHNPILERVRAVLYDNVAAQLQQLAGPEALPSVPLPIMAQFISGGLLALIHWWHDQEFPYPPEVMDAFFQQMAMPGLLALLEESGPSDGSV